MSNNWYLRNPLTHRNRRRSESESNWTRSFSCAHMNPLIICRGPIRMEAMDVFDEMGIVNYGILLSEKDSITYTNALSPELRKKISPARVHRVQDYTGASKEERNQRIGQIVSIARDNGYDSIFAGYGFMAEDEDMVAAMENAGLIFIGPCSATIRAAGSKDLAKRTALDVGISVTPGVHNATTETLIKKYADSDLDGLISKHKLKIKKAALTACKSIVDKAELILLASYQRGIDLFSIEDLAETLSNQIKEIFANDPDTRVRLKAIGGGGGKGQRILDCPAQFEGEIAVRLNAAVAQTEPMLREVLSEVKATGEGDNKNVIAEVNCEVVRHEEIQVVGNGDWCITMGGRDCSAQMNEQKLLEVSVTVEELENLIDKAKAGNDQATVSALETDLRILKELEDEGAKFGAAVGLDSVSTFESIIDRGNHYFMEMNTRVQVEHRVTELCYELSFENPADSKDVFTVDSIIELMVLLACHGSRLPKPERVKRHNTSVEVRLNATDDALKPSPGGIITNWSATQNDEIRDDQGICLHNPDTDVFMKYHLTGAYDSNIALLLTTGEDRAESFTNMAEILRQTRIVGDGVHTNLNFHYGMINWFIGNNSNARPTTSFVSIYLTAVGQLKKLANEMDIVYAYDDLQRMHVDMAEDPAVKGAVAAIMQQKSSLLARVLNIMLAQPHFISGWLAVNQKHFEIDDKGIHWLSNPVNVLADLYHFLNMEGRKDTPALYAIWDHDRELLQKSVDFYGELETKLSCDNWHDMQVKIDSLHNKKVKGIDSAAVLAAHVGFQLGLDILKILPYIGRESGFFELKVLPDLTIQLPERFQADDLRSESRRVLSPPPVSAADEISAPSGGMFYSRETPDREPFVVEGQHFEEGDPLFIIEVMKMFNKFNAPFAGTVDKVLVDTDATILKKGQIVYKVTPDEKIIEESPQEQRAKVIANTDLFLRFINVTEGQS